MVLHTFNSISVILEKWEGNNERLCATKSCVWLYGFLPQEEIKMPDLQASI